MQSSFLVVYMIGKHPYITSLFWKKFGKRPYIIMIFL